MSRAPEYHVRDAVFAVRRDLPEPPPIRGPEDVEALMRDLRHAEREGFYALVLNARHECQAVETVGIGTLNACLVHPRDVFRRAIELNAASLILVHCHPSGDSDPSEEDLTQTRRLIEAGDLLGITILDHIIIASRSCYSLRASGRGGF